MPSEFSNTSGGGRRKDEARGAPQSTTDAHCRVFCRCTILPPFMRKCMRKAIRCRSRRSRSVSTTAPPGPGAGPSISKVGSCASAALPAIFTSCATLQSKRE